VDICLARKFVKPGFIAGFTMSVGCRQDREEELVESHGNLRDSWRKKVMATVVHGHDEKTDCGRWPD
jgi:hypothetical protein